MTVSKSDSKEGTKKTQESTDAHHARRGSLEKILSKEVDRSNGKTCQTTKNDQANSA